MGARQPGWSTFLGGLLGAQAITLAATALAATLLPAADRWHPDNRGCVSVYLLLAAAGQMASLWWNRRLRRSGCEAREQARQAGRERTRLEERLYA
jgi:protein-S-isoprenylcysteine O-methyltransferase Ste14